MANSYPDQENGDGAERRVYYPEDEGTRLSETILEAIAAYEDVDLARSESVLYDVIDPDALDNLFKADADANVIVEFTVDDLRVTLIGDGGVDVRVTDADGLRR